MSKTAYDDPAALRREVVALRLLGPPVVRLLGNDQAGLLLEEVVPGASVADLPDDQATLALAAAMRSMWRPVPAGCDLPSVEQECAPLLTGGSGPLAGTSDAHEPAGGSGSLAGMSGAHEPAGGSAGSALNGDPLVPRRLLILAGATLAGLLASSAKPVVLHGDLHHGNLLRGPAGWVAIDPHGVTGEPAYDVGPLLLNPLERDVTGLVGRRLDLLAVGLGLDRERLRQWGLVRAVLACAWDVQAGRAPRPQFLEVADALLADGRN